MDARGGSLLIICCFVLLCGPRWSRKSLDSCAVLLFILALVSRCLVPEIDGFCMGRGDLSSSAGRGGRGNRWILVLFCCSFWYWFLDAWSPEIVGFQMGRGAKCRRVRRHPVSPCSFALDQQKTYIFLSIAIHFTRLASTTRVLRRIEHASRSTAAAPLCIDLLGFWLRVFVFGNSWILRLFLVFCGPWRWSR